MGPFKACPEYMVRCLLVLTPQMAPGVVRNRHLIAEHYLFKNSRLSINPKFIHSDLWGHQRQVRTHPINSNAIKESCYVEFSMP